MQKIVRNYYFAISTLQNQHFFRIFLSRACVRTFAQKYIRYGRYKSNGRKTQRQ